MAIFRITKDKNKADKSERQSDFFRSEFELRDFFKDNLEKLLGVRFLEKEYPIPEGRIDTLGIDEDKLPVIIEYKWDKDDGVLTQGLAYYAWLKANRRPFQDLVKNKLGNEVTVNWDQPRVILVAQDFSRQIKVAVKEISHVELVTYACYKPDILHLEGIKITTNTKVRPVGDESGNTIIYDRNFHFSQINSQQLKEKIEILRQKVMGLPDVEEIEGQQTGISYKSTRKFVRFSFHPIRVEVLLKSHTFSSDVKKVVRDITANGWGYDGLLKFTAESDVDYVFEIIKEAYNQTQ